MKYCEYCGKELFDQAVVCPDCGCPTSPQTYQPPKPKIDLNHLENDFYINTLSSRLNINGIIWLVIGILQIILGLAFFNLFVAIIGVLNIIDAIKDMKYSKEILIRPVGIIGRAESLAGPIITLVYNILFGGLVGVIGSIYYLTPIRGFIMSNKYHFIEIENAVYKG